MLIIATITMIVIMTMNPIDSSSCGRRPWTSLRRTGLWGGRGARGELQHIETNICIAPPPTNHNVPNMVSYSGVGIALCESTVFQECRC